MRDFGFYEKGGCMTFDEWLNDAGGEAARMWLYRFTSDIERKLARLYLEQAHVAGVINALTAEKNRNDD